jgi:RCC1 and BTB domain-containing protein
VSAENGDVYACGYNDSGQCGVGTTSRLLELTVLPSLGDKGVVSIHSYNGCEHLLCVTGAGGVVCAAVSCV